MDEYLVPTKAADEEYTVQRSRFIGHVWPVENEEEALALLKQTREKYWNANHNVYALPIADAVIARLALHGAHPLQNFTIAQFHIGVHLLACAVYHRFLRL